MSETNSHWFVIKNNFFSKSQVKRRRQVRGQLQKYMACAQHKCKNVKLYPSCFSSGKTKTVPLFSFLQLLNVL